MDNRGSPRRAPSPEPSVTSLRKCWPASQATRARTSTPWDRPGTRCSPATGGAIRPPLPSTGAMPPPCAAHGLPATVRPVELRPRSEEWLARHGGWSLALLCGLGAMAATAAFGSSAWWTVAGAAFGYMLSWGLRPPASEAPLSGLPAPASGLLRLADGVARRALLLRERRPDLVVLASAAESAATTARAGDGDPVLAQRLLELAASLDEALAPEAACP